MNRDPGVFGGNRGGKRAEKPTPGKHILAVKASDNLGNTTYQAFEIEVK